MAKPKKKAKKSSGQEKPSKKGSSTKKKTDSSAKAREKAAPSAPSATSRATKPERGKREIVAAIVAVVVGGPLVFLFVSALLDANERNEADPIVAMIGPEAFQASLDGDTSPLHYYGRDRTAPDFTLRDQHGDAWSLADQRGKVVVMNFWSITCAPCIQEMPSLIELSRLVKDRDDIEVIAVSTDENWSQVGRIFPRRMHLKVLFDPERAVVNGQFGTRVYPETWFIDPDGVIRMRVDGKKEWDSALVMQLIDRFSS